jgi:tetratricopeptide (TPR) repeat protein
MASRRPRSDVPSPRASLAPPRPMMASAAPLVGRDAELARLGAALAPGRLVTVVGPPGVGKSRLAARAAELHGGAVVSLRGVSDARSVTRRVTRALGGNPRASGDALVVCDDADALDPEARRLVADWAGAGLRMVVTARAPLGLRGEGVLPLAPLALDGDALVLLRALLAVGGAPPPPDGDAGSRARIDDAHAKLVRPTSGLPLAIELVAAMAVTSGVELALYRLARAPSAVLDVRLDDDALLRRAIEPAWETLDDAERRALASLSVLAGTFDADVGERLLGDGGAARLEALCRRGLVHAAPGQGLQLLRPVAAFAAEHLDAATRAQAERRHAEVFAARRAARPDEWADLVSALRRTLARGEAEGGGGGGGGGGEGDAGQLALDLVGALEPIVAAGGSAAEHLELADRVVSLADRAGLPETGRLRARLVRGDAARRVGRLDAAHGDFAEVERVASERGDVALAARAARGLGAVAHVRAELREAERELGRALALATTAGDDELVGIVRSDLGTNLLALGDVAGARRELERSVEALTRAGNVLHGAGARANLGVACLDAGELAAARRELDAALALLRGSDSIVVGFVHASLGLVDHLEDQLDAAAARYAAARIVAEDARSPRFEGTFAGYAAIAALEQGKIDDAHGHVLRATAALHEAEEPRYEGLFLAVKAALAWWSGREDTARDDLAAATALAGDGPFRSGIGAVAAALGAAGVAVAAEASVGATGGVAPGEAPGVGSTPPVEERLLRRVARALAREALGRGASAPTLRVAPDGSWFGVGDEPKVTLDAHAAARRLLTALVDAHAAGEGRSRDALVTAAWPGERLTAESGRNRLKVLVSQLRKAGLAALVETTADGYALGAACRVVVSRDADLPGIYRPSATRRGRATPMTTHRSSSSVFSRLASSASFAAFASRASVTSVTSAALALALAACGAADAPVASDDVVAAPGTTADGGSSSGSACAPAWDARGEGACRAEVGYAWNGTACAVLYGCRCEGADCARVASRECAPTTPACRPGGEADAGEPPTADGGSSSGSACAPAWDARGEGACRAEVGYAWNGTECAVLYGCRCEGADCDRVASRECAPTTPACRPGGEADAGDRDAR